MPGCLVTGGAYGGSTMASPFYLGTEAGSWKNLLGVGFFLADFLKDNSLVTSEKNDMGPLKRKEVGEDFVD